MKPGEFYPESDSKYISDLIQRGEGEKLEFKFEISDARKIARTLVAFANTSGGTLLIGVKDNGAIAGIRSDEEYYMLDAASTMYCRPQISFRTKLHNLEGKQVLEVLIEKSSRILHSAPDKEGKYKVYIRKKDENLIPGGIYLKIHYQRLENKPVTIEYGLREQLLLKYLMTHETITLQQYRKLAKIPYSIAEQVMIDFIILNLIGIEVTDKGHLYFLKDPQMSMEILNSIQNG